MGKINLSLVIPANDEIKLKRSLRIYGKFFDTLKNKLSTEIIVVSSSSNPKIFSVAKNYSEEFPFIKSIQTPYVTGKGGAVALGFNAAVGNIVGYVDSDGAISANEILKLYNLLVETESLDGVIGSRIKEHTSLKRKLFVNIFWLVGKFMFGLSYKDTQCGIKLFRKKAAKEIASKLSNTGYAFDINLLLISKYLNFNIREIPIKWDERYSNNLHFVKRSFEIGKELFALKALELASFLTEKSSAVLKNSNIKEGKSKKKILIFAWRDIKHPEMGGSEMYVHQIAKRLAKKHRVTLFTSKPGNLSSYDKLDGIEIIRKGSFITVYLYAFLSYIFNLRKSADFIIDVENGLPFFTPLFSRRPKLMLLHHVHKEQWFKQFILPIALVGYLVERFIMPIIYRNIPVITVSPSSLDELRNIGFNDKKVYLAYNAVKIPKKIIKKSHTPMLLYVGRIKAYKRIEIAVKAFKTILDSNRNIEFYIGGTGDFEGKLRTYISKLNLENKIHMLGFISDKRKLELMQKAWVFLMPSMKEGWGVTITEAASCGTPSIGFNVSGVKDSIKDLETGLLTNSEEGFKSSIIKMLSNQKLRKLMSNNCILWAKRFSWDFPVRVFEKVITESAVNKGLLSNRSYPWLLSLSLYTF